MSQGNVEIVKRVIDDYNRRDLDAYDQFFTPDFELFPALRGAVEGGSYRGREGIERVFDATRDTWEDFRLIAHEFRDLGDRVLVVGRVEGRGRGSGIPVDAPTDTIFDFRDGKVSHVRAYLDHGEALRAAGLAE
jgi:ketosteroid isomerase-like protein